MLFFYRRLTTVVEHDSDNVSPLRVPYFIHNHGSQPWRAPTAKCAKAAHYEAPGLG